MSTNAAPRSYVRVAATRVAGSTSNDSLEEAATATRRWTSDETSRRVAAAPEFRHPRLPEDLLDEVVAGYVHITGDAVRRPPKRNLIAACCRVHGDGFLPLVARLFASRGSATNLLGLIRCMEPTEQILREIAPDPAPRQQAAQRRAPEPPAPIASPMGIPREDLLPGLIYGELNRPMFDPTSRRRYDRRPSNPDAAAFFEEEELGPRPGRSHADRALSR